MLPLVPTFLPMVTLAPMVPLAAEKCSGFSCYQRYHWLSMVPLVKFPMVPLGEFRTHALFASESFRRFRDSSAQNHFGPGLLGPDVSAHFSVRDCSAHLSGTARPIFFFFLGGGGGRGIYCFILFMCIKIRVKTLYLFNMIIILAAPYQRR